MAKKITKPAAPVAAPKAAPALKAMPVAKATPVRNTPIPKPAPTLSPRREITHEMIARRAYEIYASGKGGSEQDNWHRAERELRSGR